MLELVVLASGSSGNAAVVRDRATGRAVLVDCGICKRDFFARLDAAGVDPLSIEAVLVTHEHTDHTKGLGVVLRGLAKLDCRPPLYTHPAVRAASREIRETEGLVEQRELMPGGELGLAGIGVLPFATSHDAAASVGFRFESKGGDALGFMTDTGHVTPAAHDALQEVRILGIESNHDPVMLRQGPYPYPVKRRVASDAGHLSNGQCAEEVAALLHGRLERIVALHISQNNNTFDLPRDTLRALLAEAGHPADVQSALPRTPVRAS